MGHRCGWTRAGRRGGWVRCQRVRWDEGGGRWVKRWRAGGSGGDGEEGGAGLLEGGDHVDVAEGQAYVVEALHEAPAGVAVDLEGGGDADRLREHAAGV